MLQSAAVMLGLKAESSDSELDTLGLEDGWIRFHLCSSLANEDNFIAYV